MSRPLLDLPTARIRSLHRDLLRRRRPTWASMATPIIQDILHLTSARTSPPVTPSTIRPITAVQELQAILILLHQANLEPCTIRWLDALVSQTIPTTLTTLTIPTTQTTQTI